MAEATRLEMAIDLMKSNNAGVQSWITRLIAINGALGTAVGVILGLQESATNRPLMPYILTALAVLGIMATLTIGQVTKRQLDWTYAYIKRIQEYQHKEPLILPNDVEKDVGMRIPRFVSWTQFVLIACWFGLIASLWILWP